MLIISALHGYNPASCKKRAREESVFNRHIKTGIGQYQRCSAQDLSKNKKGIVKVAGKSLTQDEVNKIAIVAPDATVNIIKNYNVKEKIKVKTPDVIDNVVKCSNPVCITNNEQMPTKFYVVKKDPLKIKCHYCERSMGKADIEII